MFDTVSQQKKKKGFNWNLYLTHVSWVSSFLFRVKLWVIFSLTPCYLKHVHLPPKLMDLPRPWPPSPRLWDSLFSTPTFIPFFLKLGICTFTLRKVQEVSFNIVALVDCCLRLKSSCGLASLYQRGSTLVKSETTYGEGGGFFFKRWSSLSLSLAVGWMDFSSSSISLIVFTHQ